MRGDGDVWRRGRGWGGSRPQLVSRRFKPIEMQLERPTIWLTRCLRALTDKTTEKRGLSPESLESIHRKRAV
jgi:hypothetical protein